MVALRIGPKLARSIAPGLKHFFAVGIGFFLLFVGLHEAGIVRGGARRFARSARPPRPRGLWLDRGAALGVATPPQAVFALPFQGDLSLRGLAFSADIRGVLELSFLPILLTLFLVSFLDTIGTLSGLGAAGEMLDESGDLPAIEGPMLVNALSCIFAAVVGTSTSGAFLESVTGIREGARTALAALTTALLEMPGRPGLPSPAAALRAEQPFAKQRVGA